MVDAPKRIWSNPTGSMSVEYVRADLYEQVERERDGFRDIAARKSDQVAALIKAGFAERLAGARVKATSDELSRYIERCRELSDGGEYSWWSRLAEILSALAEPAGEAEPLSAQIERLASFIMEHVPGEPSQSEGAVDCAIRIIRNSLSTPPNASAIREAAEMARACLASLVSAGHNYPPPEPEQIENAFWELDKALAGAKP